MFHSSTIIAAILCYIGLLFCIGLWVERRTAAGGNVANHPLIYSLSLAIYCTSWTYYGSVGNAATSGMFFLTIYLGPTLTIILWWQVLRKLVRLKNSQHITSIADFIAARYGKSQQLAAMATVIALVSNLPYIALQLKAVITTFAIITEPAGHSFSWIGNNVGPIVVLLMILFTIIFGVRRLDPTERHQGMVVVVAVESLVKLVTFLAVGVFVTYFAFNGLDDIFEHLSGPKLDPLVTTVATPGPLMWGTYLILSMSAILFLPRQFHISVVENSDEDHIRTAMWLFPLYMLLINIFVFPIAKGGLLSGLPLREADSFVLRMPLQYGKTWLTLLAFIGGFSAATSMIMISAMTLATMVTNHLLLPLVDWANRLAFLRRHLLKARWVAVAVVLVCGYWFEIHLGGSFSLVRMGIISFAAFLQFAPVILGGIFWRRGSKTGAMLGLGAGFVVWVYTLLLPPIAQSAWGRQTSFADGLLGLLNPEHLFGLTGIAPETNAVIWSMFFNVGLYVLGSLLFPVTEEERRQAESFVGVLSPPSAAMNPALEQDSSLDWEEKKGMFGDVLCQYFSSRDAALMLENCLARMKVKGRGRISITELADVYNEVEKSLSGTIGTAAAHTALKRKMIFTPTETRALQDAYAEILAGLSLTPEDVRLKIDYYRERDTLLTTHAAELEEKVRELQEQIRQRRRSEDALRNSEERLQAIMDHTSAVIYLKNISGRYLLVNRQFQLLFAKTAEEVIGRADREVFKGEVAEQFMKHDLRALLENRLYEVEERIQLADGIHHYLSVKFPLYDEKMAINGICGISTDITALKKAQDQLRRLSGSIMANQEKERRAVARELHDELAQLLTALRLDCAWLRNRLQPVDEKAAERATSMYDLIDKTIDEVRTIAIRLRPGVLDDLGLIDALEWLAADFIKRSGISCTITHQDVPRVSDVIATAAYRITQEALTNVVRHAKASHVTISLRYEESVLILVIWDNGQGFDTKRLDDSEGLGIAGMRERASLANGHLSIQSRTGLGTEVSCTLPAVLKDGILQ